MSDPLEVLDFWLDEIGPDGWYAGTQEIDDACATGFGELVTAAREGNLEHWVDGPAPTLAYLLLTDQFTRNIYRGDALSFASDHLARAASRKALAEGWDMQVPEPERQFFYMAFEHSEDMADQDLAVELMETRMPSLPDLTLHAKAHREMIRRYGRFPLRNAALGRENTPEEQAFLDAGGYMALVQEMRG
ncbi:DUF924 family protein [Xinfangfangia sp. CPCC 101601]|uniref:DUF924 family protein n=1 Tax=Pseudogemmobacter lacusdianii TaxID=3069608 RepID=A0ABU0VUI5_9RHOB|nr:DUF924 family protein [Xinfangfangia sp. CPCC 101601]MDQ2065392.1 DUF924 family protein [Xinfangfangia sp. CPCC 101601]